MKRTYRIVERRILFETSDEEAHEYATTQAVPPEDIAELVKKAQAAIDPDDLHADGFGPPPHITVLYGIGDEDKDAALEVMRGFGPCRARVRGVDLFQNDDQDVVIFAVESDDLARLRDELDRAIPDNANRWPEYKPHMTVAYVAPGAGEKYKDIESDLVGREFDLDALEFSGTKDDVERIELGEPVNEESPLFGTDILDDEDSGTEDAVRKALHPVLNRSNRRVVSVREDDGGVNVLLDNGQNLVMNRGDGGSWVVSHLDERYRLDDLAALESLVRRLASPSESVAEDEEPTRVMPHLAYQPTNPEWVARRPRREQPGVERRSGTARPDVPKISMHNDGYRIILTLDVPPTARYKERGEGGTQDEVDMLLDVLSADPMLEPITKIRRASLDSIVVDVTGGTPEDFRVVRNAIVARIPGEYFIDDQLKSVKKPGIVRRAVRGVSRAVRSLGGLRMVNDDVSEDTFTSDVGFTDTIPITRVRRRKVNLPGLKKASTTRRRVKRKYEVKESMSKDASPILVVLRPQQVQALGAKPVWSALRESGVITEKPFRMGEEEFFEVSIDTLRKEWTQANAGVLLDEVGSIDPRIQRKIMERVEPGVLVDALSTRLDDWCQQVPVDVAISESTTFAESHMRCRLRGSAPGPKLVEEMLRRDAGVVRRVLEWYGLSREVLERLASLDIRSYQDASHVTAVRAAAKAILEEMTDPAAGIGGAGAGMPTANAGAATVQGYSEQQPEGVSASSRNWPAESMFKIHVLVGEMPQWVYRQVVGHEGEGEESLLVYRTPEGRVMRMPHDQIDAAEGFGAVVTPDELQGTEPGEEPMPTFEPSPQPAPEPLPVAAESVDEQQATDPNQEKLTRDAAFSKALAQYQQSKDDRDWDDVRKQAERVTGMKGPELDKALSGFAADDNRQERQPMYGGAYEDIMPPVIEDEDEEYECTDCGWRGDADEMGEELSGGDWTCPDCGGKNVEVIMDLDEARRRKDPQVSGWSLMLAKAGKKPLHPKRDKSKKKRKGDEELDEKETRQMKGRKIKEPTHMKSLAKKAGVGMDRAMKAWGEAQFDFEKAHPDVKKKSSRYYRGVTGYMKKKIGLGKKEDVDEGQEQRQAEAVRLFSRDDRFHEMLDKFATTRNEGYLIRACERASRVGGIPLNEARVLVEEIVGASKK